MPSDKSGRWPTTCATCSSRRSHGWSGPRPSTSSNAARAARYGVSVLTNDLRAFHGPHWELEVDLLQRMDHIVDCSDTGILKPHRRAYERAVEITGVPAERQLFVDDLPLNVQGAEAAGMDAVWFDIAHAAESWAAVAARLGL